MTKQHLEEIEKAIKDMVHDPQIIGTVDEFHGCIETYCGLWCSGESGNTMPDGLRAFDYFTMSPDYIFGVHPDMDALLRQHDAWAEWHDAGTMMVYSQEESDK